MDLKSNCPICKRERTYKTKQGFLKGLEKPCNSCANSISQGGVGGKYVGDKVRCSKCELVLSSDKFLIKDGKPYSRCRSCHAEASKKYYKETDKYARYGITKEEYEILLKDQSNKCCGCEITMIEPHIDHCHITGKVRGLLCHSCNVSLGLLKDNVNTLNNLIKYLKENNG